MHACMQGVRQRRLRELGGEAEEATNADEDAQREAWLAQVQLAAARGADMADMLRQVLPCAPSLPPHAGCWHGCHDGACSRPLKELWAATVTLHDAHIGHTRFPRFWFFCLGAGAAAACSLAA
jgi:hypothetical protein